MSQLGTKHLCSGIKAEMETPESINDKIVTIYIKKTVFNLEAIVFSISSIQKVVQFSKSNPTNYLFKVLLMLIESWDSATHYV